VGVVTEEHRQLRYSNIGTARRVVVIGPNPLHHHAHQSEVHMQVYIEGMCAAKGKNGFSKDREVGRCIGAGGAFDSPSGCPQ
jgi:hypothetical protein